MADPEVPEPPKDENGKIDSSFQFKYYKEHFFDKVDFGDKRFVRSPLFHQKVEQYIEKLTVPHPDSIGRSIDVIMSKAEQNEELNQYLTAHFLNKYAKSKIMGMDAVYVYMVDNYYSKGKAEWVDSVQLFKIRDRADMMRPNLIGKKAPNFRLKDADGNYHVLYNQKSPYVVLYFWDPDCGHCKKSTPKVYEFYQNYKAKGVEVIAISTEHEEDKWRKYLEENELGWLNLRDFQYRSNFRRDYDLSGTPRIFILDKDKTIIGKRLGADQLPNFMDRIIKRDEAQKDKAATEEKEKGKTEQKIDKSKTVTQPKSNSPSKVKKSSKTQKK